MAQRSPPTPVTHDTVPVYRVLPNPPVPKCSYSKVLSGPVDPSLFLTAVPQPQSHGGQA